MTRSVVTALLLVSVSYIPAFAAVPEEKTSPLFTLSNDASVPAPAIPLKVGQKVVTPVASKATAKSAQPRTPCITAQDDGTGEILKFSGGGGSLNGLSFQSAKLNLKPDSAVPVTLDFDRASAPVRLTGYAPSAHLVIVNTSAYKTLYEIAQQSGTLKARVGGQGPATELAYPLEGITTAFADMELCYQGNPARLAQPAGTVPLKQEKTEVVASVPPVQVDATDLEGDDDNLTIAGEQSQGHDEEVEVDLGSIEISDEPFVPPTVPLPEDVVAAIPSSVSDLKEIPVTETSSPLPEKEIQVVPVPTRPQITTVARSSLSNPSLPIQETTLTFRARKDEELRDVMRRWAERAGVDLVWNTPGDVKLKKDFSFFGNFKGAVAALVKEYPDARMNTAFVNPPVSFPEKPYIAQTMDEAPAAPVTIPGNDLRDFVPVPPPAMVEPAADASGLSIAHRPVLPPTVRATAPAVMAPVAATSAAEQAKPFGPTRRWRALQGASLRQVMQAWAEDAGVMLVWQARQDYALPLSVNMSADYGRALNYVLEQYRFEGARPTGQVYDDPAGGKKVLVIRSQQG